MVAAVANPKNPNILDPNSRPPLTPSERDNAVTSRRPRAKDIHIPSRYLSTTSNSSSITTTTTTTTSSSTTSSSSSSSGNSSSSTRRFPSPFLTAPPSMQNSSSSTAVLLQQKRSNSVGRNRPVAASQRDPPRLSTGNSVLTVDPPPEISLSSSSSSSSSSSAAARALCTMTRSLSVSFQGESFFYQTSKAKEAAPSPARKHTPDRRRMSTVSIASPRSGWRSDGCGDQMMENPRSGDHLHRWPASSRRAEQLSSLTRCLDFSMDKQQSLVCAVRLLPNSIIFEEGRRISYDGGDLSSDSDSGSNSGMLDSGVTDRPRFAPRGRIVPARFMQDNVNTGNRQLQDLGCPLARSSTTSKLVSPKNSVMDSPLSSPRTSSSPLHGGHLRSPSPAKITTSRAVTSPWRMRSNGGGLADASSVSQPGLAPSIISFAAEVRRSKKGENRIEEAHLLRLLHNRHLQLRFVNARANAAMVVHKMTAEKTLYNAWLAMSEMRDCVTIKRIKLQFLTRNLKLMSILKRQMAYLEEWSLMDKEHLGSLTGSIEALKASTLRLPVVGGARADVQDVKEVVSSAVNVMQAMGSSICSLLSKAEGASSLVSEIAEVATQEQALLDEAKDLLSTVASLHLARAEIATNTQASDAIVDVIEVLTLKRWPFLTPQKATTLKKSSAIGCASRCLFFLFSLVAFMHFFFCCKREYYMDVLSPFVAMFVIYTCFFCMMKDK